MTCGEHCLRWHKHLLLAVLNNRTSYFASIGCETTRVLHGRIHYIILAQKLGKIPYEPKVSATVFAHQKRNRAKMPIDHTTQSIMHLHLENKEYYDRKARADPLKEKVTVSFCSQ